MFADKNRHRLALIAIGVVLILAIFPYFRPVEPLVIEDSVGDSTVYIEAERDWMLFPGRCMQVRWELERIEGVYVKDMQPERSTVGFSEERNCYAPNFELTIIFDDDNTIIYTLDDITYGYQQIHWQLYYLVLIILGSVSSYVGIGARMTTFLLSAVLITHRMIFQMLSFFTGYADVIPDPVIHIRWARTASLETLIDLPPHMLFHLTGRVLMELTPWLYDVVPIIVFTVVCQALTAVGLHTLLRVMYSPQRTEHGWHMLYIFISVSLLFIGPISLLAGVFQQQYGFALVYPNTYHSPTQIMMRPFSVWLFIALVTLPTKATVSRLSLRWAWITLLTIMVTLTKPNYTFVILPAYVTLLCWQALLRRGVSRNQIVTACVLVLSGTLVLGWQLLTLSAGTSQVGETELIFAPFSYFALWDVTIPMVFVQWFASLVFPIAVVIAFFKQAWEDETMLLAWITLGGSILISALFLEVPRSITGNFLWSSRIANLILFGVSAGFLLQRARELGWRNLSIIVCSGLFFAHLINHLIIMY